ncbi:hypothetical protein [Kluyvera georgiana]|uniref:hypothetical protein n=1 Tax=Kluyvera georgiana TaxID=73098 RepID=UPI003AEF685E
MTNNELSYVQIPTAKYEALLAALARKENLQFTTEELRALLEMLHHPYACNGEIFNEVRNKVLMVWKEAQRNDQ